MSNDLKNLIITILLSTIILFGWQFFFERPKQIENEKIIALQKQLSAQETAKETPPHYEVPQENKPIEQEKLVIFKNQNIEGFISTKGLRFTELKLLKYLQKQDSNSPAVELLSEKNEPYFVEFGFLSKGNSVEVPGSNTVWSVDNTELSSKTPAIFSWANKQGVKFIVEIAVDEHYLFSIKQKVINISSEKIEVNNYGRVNRQYTPVEKAMSVSFEGAVGVFDKNLKEVSYGDLQDDGRVSFNNVSRGWLGITDKYWMTAIVPDNRYSFTSNFIGYKKESQEKFQVDYLSESFELAAGQEKEFENYLYAGAKELDLIDGYQNTKGFELFDRAVDFGWFYFITKPIYLVLKFFDGYLHNYGLSIIAITLLIKILMFPLANKSFRSMNKMKILQPEMTRLKELYGSDQIKLNSETMALYKKHNVNPLSGCLPLLVQIPVFFSLYKVIYISIDMRHAPFYGWLKDLSVPDPTSITNLFGLLPYEPLPYLTIGVLPILMGITMYLQQKLSPEPADPIQAKVMKFLPLIFLFLFSGFPSGLLLYWTFSNIISILQQLLLMKSVNESKN